MESDLDRPYQIRLVVHRLFKNQIYELAMEDVMGLPLPKEDIGRTGRHPPRVHFTLQRRASAGRQVRFGEASL
jgi:hypothetical protein